MWDDLLVIPSEGLWFVHRLALKWELMLGGLSVVLLG